MKEGFGDPRTSFLLGKVAALISDLSKDFWNRVRGAGEVVTKLALQHGQIVEVVARNKGGGGSEIEKLLNFSQAGSFMIIHMGKTKVRSVPYRRDFGMFPNDFANQGVSSIDTLFGSPPPNQ